MFDVFFKDLPIRRGERNRLAEIVVFVASRDEFSRSDIMRAVEISKPQATTDLAKVAAALPGLFTYCPSRKRFLVDRRVAESAYAKAMPKRLHVLH